MLHRGDRVLIVRLGQSEFEQRHGCPNASGSLACQCRFQDPLDPGRAHRAQSRCAFEQGKGRNVALPSGGLPGRGGQLLRDVLVGRKGRGREVEGAPLSRSRAASPLVDGGQCLVCGALSPRSGRVIDRAANEWVPEADAAGVLHE